MNEKYVHSFLSNLPSIIFLLLIIQKNYSLIIGLSLVVTLVHTIKKLSNNIPKDNILYKITRRPANGVYCGVSCLEKKTHMSDPGFPSGHTAFITFYALCLPQSFYFTVVKIILVLSVSYNRIHSSCHTCFQVIGGILFGGYLQRFLIL